MHNQVSTLNHDPPARSSKNLRNSSHVSVSLSSVSIASNTDTPGPMLTCEPPYQSLVITVNMLLINLLRYLPS